MSISSINNMIRIWNIKNFECLISINNVNSNRNLHSACFLSENNNNYIITSNCNWAGDSEPIKIYDFNGNKIKEINNSNEKTYFIDTYYDKILNKYFIITGNFNYVKSYDYRKNVVYHKYNDSFNNDNKCHLSVIIKSNEKIPKLIESCQDGYVRIWNFHSGSLINKIRISNKILYGLCLWNDNYLFVGCEDKTIKLIDIKIGFVIETLIGHNNSVLTIKKINHKVYGECLVSEGWKSDQIKLWFNYK